MATYYLDGNTLSNSSAIYTNSNLTSCAPDGFYSDGVISREQISCVLSAIKECKGCAAECGTPVTSEGIMGVQNISTYVGQNTSDIGAIIIRFYTYAIPTIPRGIKATYNGNSYNQLSSIVDGYHASTNPTSPTFIGDSALDCGLSGTVYPNVPTYEYDGSTFNFIYNQTVSVAPGDVSLGVDPVSCVMVIPKTSALPSKIDITIYSLCDADVWGMDIECPIKLTPFPTTTNLDAFNVCDGLPINIAYNAPVNGSPGVPEVYDWVFIDPNGEFIVPDGWYRHPDLARRMLINDGVIVLIDVCPA